MTKTAIMATPRKPTAILELNGAFKNHPARGRARANEPKPDPDLGLPPGRLTKNEKAAWCEIAVGDLIFNEHGAVCRVVKTSGVIVGRPRVLQAEVQRWRRDHGRRRAHLAHLRVEDRMQEGSKGGRVSTQGRLCASNDGGNCADRSCTADEKQASTSEVESQS